MIKITGNESVYPVQKSKMVEDEGVTSYQTTPGLTIRQHFAGLAMQGLCANSIPGQQHIPANLAKEAVDYADALITELNKTT